MSDPFSLCSHIISLLSVFINAYLLFVFFRCPLRRIGSYKYFFPVAAVRDILLSVSIILAVPRAVAHDYSFVFIATGPIHDMTGGSVLLLLYLLIFESSLLLVTDSFLCRYLQVCRTQLHGSYFTKRNVVLVVAANLLLLVIWMLAIYIVFWPSTQFIESQSAVVTLITGINSSECGQLGFSFKLKVSAVDLSLLLAANVYMLIIALIIVYAALKINTFLREGTISSNLRKLHRQIFTMLMLQAACPFLFLHMPNFAVYIYVFAGWSTPSEVSFMLTILVTMFPLSNPIIIIAFLSEYRKYTLSTLKFNQKTVKDGSVFVTEVKRVTTVRGAVEME
ncbi:hypothetical protein Q1695_006724 [Nippostrongylus brasiliensis]|nr:hypothetical protein Q1695_006724 [Nippostrongylus brasiliensis]